MVLDTCKKANVVFDETIATFDVINCQGVKGQVIKCNFLLFIIWRVVLTVQVNVKAPTVSIDKTDGCLIYLSKNYPSSRVVTAKSSEINISIPEGNDFVSVFVLFRIINSFYNISREKYPFRNNLSPVGTRKRASL